METYQIITIIISALSLLGVGTVCKLFWESKAAERHARSAEEQARIKKEKQDEMREVLSSELDPIEAKVDKLNEQMKLNTDGTVTLLRDRMKCSLNDCKKQGFASAADKANWNELYNSYKNLGGNHFREYVNAWKDEMDALPPELPTDNTNN